MRGTARARRVRRVRRTSGTRGTRGFSLIETMLGLLVGMLLVIVMLQLLLRSDLAKRASNASDDAQVRAQLALHLLERELRQAGHDVSGYALLGCTLGYTTTQDSRSVSLPALAPVTLNPAASVIPAGDAGSDTLLVVAGTSTGAGEADLASAATTAAAQVYHATTSGAFAAQDYVVAAPASRASPCSLTLNRVAGTGGTNGTTLTMASASETTATGSLLFNLGAAPRLRAYAVRDGLLTVCDYLAHDCSRTSATSPLDTSVWVPVASQIAALRLQYGRDTAGISGSSSAMTGVADTWDQTTPGGSADATSIPVYCRWARIVGLRLAVVGRAAQYDREVLTSSAPTWAGSDGAAIDVSGGTSSSSSATTTGSAWTHYRYRLMQGMVPLRNMLWQGGQPAYQGGTLAGVSEGC